MSKINVRAATAQPPLVLLAPPPQKIVQNAILAGRSLATPDHKHVSKIIVHALMEHPLKVQIAQ